jgi:hypothetical protein
MKRYILKLALIALSMGALVSCDEDTVTYGGGNFVSFNDVTVLRFNAFENVGVAEIPVNIAFPKSNDVVVSYSITESQAQDGVDYVNLTPNSVTIPAGETSASIKLQITNNDVLNDSKSLVITLTDVNDDSVALGIKDANSKLKNFLIVNDDCTTNFLPFVREYKVLDGDGIQIGSAQADVNDNGECNILRLTGLLEDITGAGTDPGNYIEIKLTPAGTNKNSGSFTGVQQLYCSECFEYPTGTNNTVLLSVSGNFINTTVTNPPGVLRLTVNSSFYVATSTTPLTTTSVTLEPVN